MSFTDQIAILAAGAPDTPHWFKPEMETPCPEPVYQSVDGDRLVWFKGDYYRRPDIEYPDPCPSDLMYHADDVICKNSQDITDWKTKYERERLFQWPVFYAAQVMQRINRIR